MLDDSHNEGNETWNETRCNRKGVEPWRSSVRCRVLRPGHAVGVPGHRRRGRPQMRARRCLLSSSMIGTLIVLVVSPPRNTFTSVPALSSRATRPGPAGLRRLDLNDVAILPLQRHEGGGLATKPRSACACTECTRPAHLPAISSARQLNGRRVGPAVGDGADGTTRCR